MKLTQKLIDKTYLFDDYETVDGRQQKIYGFTEEGILKFAEAIINECSGVDFRTQVGLSSDQNYEVSRAIMRHFGKTAV
jgi:hypothetical protein